MAATLAAQRIAVVAVLSVAASYVGWASELPPHANRSQCVDQFNVAVGNQLGDPWCAAFVYHCGRFGCWDLQNQRSYWPVLKSGGCASLGSWASAKGVLVDEPQVGDVFLLWHLVGKEERFAHTGFVTGVNPAGTYTTVEGNTNVDGSRDGWGVFRRTRSLHPKDRFIRWTSLI